MVLRRIRLPIPQKGRRAARIGARPPARRARHAPAEGTRSNPAARRACACVARRGSTGPSRVAWRRRPRGASRPRRERRERTPGRRPSGARRLVAARSGDSGRATSGIAPAQAPTHLGASAPLPVGSPPRRARPRAQARDGRGQEPVTVLRSGWALRDSRGAGSSHARGGRRRRRRRHRMVRPCRVCAAWVDRNWRTKPGVSWTRSRQRTRRRRAYSSTRVFSPTERNLMTARAFCPPMTRCTTPSPNCG